MLAMATPIKQISKGVKATEISGRHSSKISAHNRKANSLMSQSTTYRENILVFFF
jgi:hypothetical protein